MIVTGAVAGEHLISGSGIVPVALGTPQIQGCKRSACSHDDQATFTHITEICEGTSQIHRVVMARQLLK